MENDKIKALQREIELEEAKMKSCGHNFGASKYDPEKIREEYGSKLVSQGSDHWYQPEGWRDALKPRWSRKCSKCGYIQYAYSEKVTEVKKEPDFK